MINILITGGAGYIGSYLVKLLRKNKNYKITCLDNLTFEQSFQPKSENVIKEGDVRDESLCQN